VAQIPFMMSSSDEHEIAAPQGILKVQVRTKTTCNSVRCRYGQGILALFVEAQLNACEWRVGFDAGH
jgi:hypothetical protein